MWGMPGMMLAGTVFWLILLAALGLVLWWALSQRRPPRRDTALDILRERYARGELTREEFEAQRRDLMA
ncbi:MAG TPA: SHOCT domain-containing protein [Methylomirabilota bacterium]|jgi:putative membrane protein|nr:SHOCT domain-containing protein [Methylomirabilota bacterium]